MHCFASENQTYTGTWLFGVESWKSLKGQENLLLKNLQVKTRVENVRFLSWRIFFVGKYGIQSTNEMAFKRTLTLRASFRFPSIRFDAPTLLSFSGFTHAHAKCPLFLVSKVRKDFSRLMVFKQHDFRVADFTFIGSKKSLPLQRRTRPLCHCFVNSGFPRKTKFA